MLVATKSSSSGVVMLRAALVVTSLIFGMEIGAEPVAFAGPPYQNCNEAHADGRYSIPSTDSAYRPDLDLDGDGLACEPSKGGRRSTR
jgi:Excalibur calcium-binding domain